MSRPSKVYKFTMWQNYVNFLQLSQMVLQPRKIRLASFIVIAKKLKHFSAKIITSLICQSFN
jgi:hypothetical protein